MMDLENFESALPAVVTSVNADGTIDARPCIRKVGRNGVVDLANLPIPRVPLMEFGGAAARFSFPAKVGDQVLLVAISRDAGKWKHSKSDDVIPKSSTGNTLNDFVAVQICIDASKAMVKISVSEDGLVKVESRRVFLDASDVEISGDLTVRGEVTAMAALPTSAVKLSTHVHPTAVGPTSPPTPGT